MPRVYHGVARAKKEAFAMAFTTSDGGEIWYEAQGDGPALILTGGFGLLDQQYSLVTPLLAKRFRVLNWNWRGAGKSDRVLSEPYSVEAWTRDLQAVATAAGVDQAYLWGTSSGSLVYIHFAARNLDLVRALILYPSFRTTLEGRKRYRLYLQLFDQFGWDALAAIFSFVGLSEERLRSPEGIAFQAWERDTFINNLNPESIEPVFSALSCADLSADLPRLKGMPVLLVGGSSGRVGMKSPAVQESIDILRDMIGSVEIKLIEGTGGTYCMLEKPEETVAVVAEFLDTL